MKKVPLALCMIGFCFLAGCSKIETSKSSSNTNAPLPAASAVAGMADDETTTGIAECDAILLKMRQCIASNNVSEALRESYRRSYQETRDGYKKVGAGSPSEKTQGARMCQLGMDAGKALFDTCK